MQRAGRKRAAVSCEDSSSSATSTESEDEPRNQGRKPFNSAAQPANKEEQVCGFLQLAQGSTACVHTPAATRACCLLSCTASRQPEALQTAPAACHRSVQHCEAPWPPLSSQALWLAQDVMLRYEAERLAGKHPQAAAGINGAASEAGEEVCQQSVWLSAKRGQPSCVTLCEVSCCAV